AIDRHRSEARLMATNWLDRALAEYAPGLAARRAMSRAKLASAEQILAMYDGATRGPRVGYRNIGGTSANTEIMRSRRRLVDVSRDLERNNPLAASCRWVWRTNVVGTGIIPAVNMENQRLKKTLQSLIGEHLDTTAVDFDERNNLYGLQATFTDALVRDGECLVVRYLPSKQVARNL